MNGGKPWTDITEGHSRSPKIITWKTLDKIKIKYTLNVPQGGNLSWATVTQTHTYNKPHKICTEYRQYKHASLHCTVKTVHNTVGIKSVQVGNSHLLLFRILMAVDMNEFLYLFNLHSKSIT